MASKAWPIFVFLICLLALKCNAQSDQDVQRSGRIIADILEMFAPSESRRSSRLPPYNINRRYTDEDRIGVSSDSKPWSSLAQGVMNMFTVSTTTPVPTTQSPLSSGIFGNLADRFKIPGMFKSLFNSDEEQTITTTSAPSSTLFPTFPTLAPLFPGLFAPSTTTEESVFNGLKNLFEKPKSGSQIDTGKMDRFIIREQASNPDDFWSNLMGNKWNERGIQWEDGTIKLVNKRGNKLLGAEMAVHDRSIDIPVQRWFEIASDVLNTAYQQKEREFNQP